MTHPLSASHYSDHASQAKVRIVENVPIAKQTYRLRFDCQEIATRIVPGQFVMIRLADGDDPLLARPFALYDTVLGVSGKPVGLDIVYLVLGKMTTRLAGLLPGTELDVWGPLGNGFSSQESGHLVMVAGGIGQTPFPALAQEAFGRRSYGDPPRSVAAVQRVTLCYGARSSDYLADIDRFEHLGVDVRVSTDDGTAGHKGLVTDLVKGVLSEKKADEQIRIVCCGPEPMMESVAAIAAQSDISCQVSLETPMACGIGICFSCVTRVRDATGEWDYKRTCVDGPVFEASQIEW
ncbi:MAG: dihydroorotate dehydrogenase electron transfer subunit [Planctomycetaceae bacterium TMED10]|nr:MAG: dihydroorotate dehydrogenase electron transfer subunit [Planctomycetaceae bacterium TMED10]